jgi:hypothetical protein
LRRQEARAARRIREIVAGAAINSDELERGLLRRGIGALQADRHACVDCGRTPLTGELVHLYAGRQNAIVCELCRWRHRDAPVASELVRHAEHGHAVRLTVRRAA